MSRSKRWSIRSYNAALRELKRGTGISHASAQQAYRAMRDRLGRSLNSADIRKHPGIKKQETERSRFYKVPEKPKKPFDFGVAGATPVTNLDEWIDMYDEWIEDEGEELEEYESTGDVDTGRKS